MDQQVFLRMRNIQKSFGTVQAVSSGHLELAKGEVHALMGENGAGKSTLMNILSGSLRSDSGTIELNGKSVTISTPTQAHELGIVKIHQELQLVPELSIAENIYLGREPVNRIGKINYGKMKADARNILQQLKLNISVDVPVKALQMGEKQLVEIARALSYDAKIIIMDEPTSALSKSETRLLFDIIRELKQKGIAFVYITHRMEEIFEISDRITVMRDGQYICTEATGKTTNADLIRWMVGRDLTDDDARDFTDTQSAVLEVENLSVAFPASAKRQDLHDISFKLYKGEVLGIAGLMGAGRSELLECLFGLHSKYMQGSMMLNGEPVTIKQPEDAIRAKMAFLTEDRKGQGLVLGRSIGENMSLPIIRELSPRFVMHSKEERKLWTREMQDISIKAPSYNTLAGSLSGGNQQKVIFGRWMLIDPDILLLDEPTRGIDVGAKGEIYKMIESLAERGKSIIVVSSELPELLRVSNRIIALCEGHQTETFLRKDATQEKLLRAATTVRSESA